MNCWKYGNAMLIEGCSASDSRWHGSDPRDVGIFFWRWQALAPSTPRSVASLAGVEAMPILGPRNGSTR